jgi:signal transduction histidine kinase
LDASSSPATLAAAGELFRGAGARVERELHARRLTDEGRQGEALRALAEVRGCVAAILSGSDPATAAGPFAAAPVHLRLLEALRRDLLVGGTGDGTHDPAAVLVAVRAIEQAREAVQDMDREDLRSRLSRPEAFDLLLEVAHDLRSPLNSILFLSETLRSGHSGPVNDQQRTQLGLIYGAALGLTTVVSDITDHANELTLASGAPEPYALSDVFRSVLQMLGPVAEEKEIELRASLPEYDRSYGHPAEIGRVLLNLGTNSLKFTEDGYVELGARRRSKHRMEFWVEDTGRGIAPERQKDLFQPFKRRLERDGEFFSSGGLGLTIARRLVAALGGDLRYETEPGRGTRFYFVVQVPASR